ncbi:uncharacterized protein K452DRAFT_284738, partial [Aplosporella prunicola CBS 121167]
MLQEFGVQGVRVQEVFGLDEALLAMLPKPVYGLIFLFRYLEDDSTAQESICPEHVWFANQTTGNACATVALLNIAMNIAGVELGENLKSFKDFTKDLTPAMRGNQIVNFEFIKRIHNSFARKIDMMNIDLGMQDQVKTAKSKKGKSKKKKKGVDDDAAFHFSAFMPIEGDVWKLDGLDRQPLRLETIGDSDWLQLIAPNISARMTQYEEGQVEFGLLALVKDPLIEAREQLAQNIKTIRDVETRLEMINSDWRAFSSTTDESENTVLAGPSSEYHITGQAILTAKLPLSIERKIDTDDDPTTLLELRQKAVTEQAALKATIGDEQASAQADQDKAEARRHDYGPLIRTWLRMLAENGTLQKLMKEV